MTTTQILATCARCTFNDFIQASVITLQFLGGRWSCRWSCPLCGHLRQKGPIPQEMALEIADAAVREVDDVAAEFMRQMGEADLLHVHTADCRHEVDQ